jgi:shikimate kinase
MRKVVLVGLMGAGKSLVGALVAQEIGWELVDVDVAITARTGVTVREIWESGGESAYRGLESEEVLRALRGEVPVVIAAPGGIVLDPVVRAGLGDAFVVWLRAETATLARRVRCGDHRPLLGDRPFDVLAVMASDRALLYEGIADAVIDTDDLDAESVAVEVFELLQNLPADT